MEILINKERITKEFIELASVDSISFGERAAADKLIRKLREIGFAVCEDDAGKYYGGSAGNIYGFLAGNQSGGSVLFSAHMDTVEPGIGKKPTLRGDGTIVSDGTTVLGADNVAGLVEILEGIRCLRESGTPHRNIEVLFSIGEEVYIKGTDKFDFGKIKSREAYVLDLSGDVGSAVVRAPSLISFQIIITGKSAHAGFEPENGINAILLASKAIGKIKQGHIDPETTLNIGTIAGGTAANIVSEECVCTGEIRSFSHAKALEQTEKLKETFAEALNGTGATFRINTAVELDAYQLPENAPVTERFLKASRALGLAGRVTSTFGGSDNHNFMKHGISGIVLSCGMYNVHSVAEYAKVDELAKGAALVAALSE